MKRLLYLVVMSTLLVDCQGATSSPLTRDTTSFGAQPDKSSGEIVPALGADCGGLEATFDSRGGHIPLPQASYSYYGALHYGAGASGLAVFYGCPGSDNNFGIPVPQGYAPDWFGQLNFNFSAVFGPADLFGKMYATVWLPKTDYFMYLYGGNNSFISSYKIGRANVKNSTLKFPSPLENGFATPSDSILNLEIVHRSQ